MTNADGAGIAPAVNTDARADLAQEADEQLSAFLSTDEAGEEQAEGGFDDHQAPSAPDPEDLFGGSEQDRSDDADTGISEAAADPLKARIRLADGSEASVEQIQEWRDAGLRTADYTRKTQEVAEQRRTLEGYAGEVSAQQTAVAEALERALAVVEAYVPAPPSTELAIRDPARYTQELAIYQSALAHVEEITQARMQLTAQARELHQADRARLLQAERERLLQAERERLFAAIPELKDDGRRHAFNQEMVRAVEAYGFSEADYAQIIDHRLIRVLADAARYQKIKAASAGRGPRPAAQRAPQPPGRRAGPAVGSEFGAALTQARRSGTSQDAARAIEAWLGAD